MTGKRGRPKGHKLSEATKLKIAKSMTGQRHSQSTKEAIRTSLLNYFEQCKRKERSMATDSGSRLDGVRYIRHLYKRTDPSNYPEIQKKRVEMCEGIMEFYNEVDLRLKYASTETQLELLACILRVQKDIERCRSRKFKRYKMRFKEMQKALEVSVARPLAVDSSNDVMECGKWPGSVNETIRRGEVAVYYAMAAIHSVPNDGGRYSLGALSSLDSAYSDIEEILGDFVPGKLTTDQKIMLSIILGHMATVERVVRLFRNDIIKYIGEDKVKEEIDEPIANLNKRSLFINSILNPVSDADVEEHLTKSKDYSRKMKVVVSRKGDGSKPEHYTIHSPLLPLEVDDMAAIKEYFPDHEEFLNDEDGRYMENNFCDVTVRKVQLGKISSKMEWVEEPVLRAVSKE